MGLFNALSPIPLTLVEGPIEVLNLLERRLRWASGFMPCLAHSRTYDTTGVRAVIGEPHRNTIVDRDYLLNSVGRHHRRCHACGDPSTSTPAVAPHLSLLIGPTIRSGD
ncbi:hypothetical protein [Mycobacterium tilburgii]|uniref:hypothetical protein n=1 Tax=Mycobacterium tilburgii TaxID=44467 RepID=UPI0011832296|nr:hypothetical protein [Mycobacterium tilburgii]